MRRGELASFLPVLALTSPAEHSVETYRVHLFAPTLGA